MNESSNAALIERLIKGDEAAFDEAYRIHGRMIYNVCLRMLDDSHAAEDTMQAVFLVLWKKAAELSTVANLGGWLHQTAVLAAREARRERQRREAREQRAAEMREHVQVDSDAHWQVVRVELDEELARLSARERSVVILSYLEGLSQSEVASALGMPKGTVASLAGRALEKLRTRFCRRGVVLSTGMLATLVLERANAVETLPQLLPSLLVAAKVTAVGTAGATAVSSAGPALAIAEGVVKTMFYLKLKVVAMTILTVTLVSTTTGIVACRVFGQEAVKQSERGGTLPREGKGDATVRDRFTVVVTPRGHDAWAAFDKLERQGGARVVMLGGRCSLLTPAELRFQPVEGRKLIEAVAATRDLKVAWTQGGKCAVLYIGCADDEVERVRKDLALTDATARREAAWRAGWLRDARVAPLLVKAAKDVDAEVANQVIISLRRVTWNVVLALDATAADLLIAELNSLDAEVRSNAVGALGSVGGDKALALIEKALADQNAKVRSSAVGALGSVGGDKALALIEKALADQNAKVRSSD
ncbi:MAG: sigma-70 family RNA polymerase sigma factor, partial [Planctomycetota bacterium]